MSKIEPIHEVDSMPKPRKLRRYSPNKTAISFPGHGGVTQPSHTSTSHTADGLNPSKYHLLYDNIESSKIVGTRSAIKNIFIIISVVPMAVYFLWTLKIIYYLNMTVPLAFTAYSVFCACCLVYAFHVMGSRKAYRETVLRLYLQNYGEMKNYVIVKPYMLTKTKKSVFWEFDITKIQLAGKSTQGCFRVNRNMHRLYKEDIVQGGESYCTEILGYELDSLRKKSK